MRHLRSEGPPVSYTHLDVYKRQLQSGVMDAWNEARLGTVMEVLCEGFDPDMGCWAGRTYADSVDVDGHVYFLSLIHI